jgi:hypothetical protein
MNEPGASSTLVGVRAVTGDRAGRLTWVSVTEYRGGQLAPGARVVVRDGEQMWLGEVLVPSERLLESPSLTDLPVIARLADASDTWPAVPDRAGRTLLDSLRLPPELLDPVSRSSSG